MGVAPRLIRFSASDADSRMPGPFPPRSVLLSPDSWTVPLVDSITNHVLGRYTRGSMDMDTQQGFNLLLGRGGLIPTDPHPLPSARIFAKLTMNSRYLVGHSPC